VVAADADDLVQPLAGLGELGDLPDDAVPLLDQPGQHGRRGDAGVHAREELDDVLAGQPGGVELLDEVHRSTALSGYLRCPLGLRSASRRNRGLGRQFAQQLVERGAAKVYATSRRPELVDVPGVEVLRVDVTDPESVTAAAAAAGDVSLLVNNAGITTRANLVTGDLADVRREMDTHFYGTLSVVRAFAPVLARNGGGGIVNVLSALSWFPPTARTPTPRPRRRRGA
jgi:hypothetical protein